MTLKAIESEFTELLQNQSEAKKPLDLRLEAPIMNELHPKIIWTRLLFKHSPQQDVIHIKIPGFSYECFPDIDNARNAHPKTSLEFVGRPWAINQFLTNHENEALVDFHELGAVYLHKGEKDIIPGCELHHHVLSHWLNYALSPELWGQHGKWTRFHHRLLDTFNQHNLLDGRPSLGYYPLKSKAEKLETMGFPGTRLEKEYLIVLPWTFSLRDLVKLEEIIRQEF